MEKIKQLGLFCLLIVFFIEIGFIIGNISEGLSPFRFFGDRERLSVDNTFFILYWGSLLGLFYLIESIFNQKGFNEILDESTGFFSSKKKKKDEELEKEEEEPFSYSGDWNVDEGPGIYFWSKNKIDKDQFEIFMSEEKKTYRDLYDNEEKLLSEYRTWRRHRT